MAAARGAQFLLCLAAGGAVSVWRRKDMNWDLQNYHFYNAWAFLENRLGYDIAPAQMQSYLNPLLDIPFFLLVQAGTPPVLIAFILGLPLGAAFAFFLWCIGYTVSTLPASERNTIAALAVVVGMTGAAGLPTAGSTMNEWHTAALIMPAVYLAMVCCAEPAERHGVLVWPLIGFLLGAAAGLKFTAAIYGVALSIAVILVLRGSISSRLETLGLLIAGGVAGLAVTYGYWGYLLIREFGNPIFPFFNAVFRSPYWFGENWHDQFRPRTVEDAVALPFRMFERNILTSNVPQRDPRMPLTLIAMAALTIGLAAGKVRLPYAHRAFAFLSVFVLAAFVVWLVVFAIYRYLIPVELIGSFLLVATVWLALRRVPWGRIMLVVLCLGLVLYTDRPNWGRRSFAESDTFFGVNVPRLPDSSLVILYGHEPLAYLLPFMGAGHRFVRPQSNFTDPAHDHRLQQRIATAIGEHDGPLYALRSDYTRPEDEARVLSVYGLKLLWGDCLPVVSTVHPGKLTLCPLQGP